MAVPFQVFDFTKKKEIKELAELNVHLYPKIKGFGICKGAN